MRLRPRSARQAAPPPAPDPAARAEEAAASVAALTAANRAGRDPDRERALVAARHAAARPGGAPAQALPPAPTRREADPGPLLPISRDDLDVESLRAGLSAHGCVHVRHLIPPEEAAELARGIDAALDAFDRAQADERDHDDEGWYAHFTPTEGSYRVGGRRQWVRASGAVWTADSPRMLFRLLEVVERTGVGALVEEYLGERPLLSANKCTLRRVPVTSNTGWHQDGAFLGAEVRTLNMWLALGPCGVDAPGLDLVPRRLDHIVETGGDGTYFDWDVAPATVEQVADGTPVVRPEFEAGDALLFDHLFLHRTAVEPTMVRERPAIETWFFGPSSYPSGQIPLAY